MLLLGLNDSASVLVGALMSDREGVAFDRDFVMLGLSSTNRTM